MMPQIVPAEQRMFMTGNEAIAWAALAAGAEIMYGYPITPQNEIMHYWTRLAPKFNTGFLQTEDELSAGFTTVGGVMAGKKAFSATAGPGNVLMQEPISMAEAMRIPAVWFIQQRGGPSTGTVIYSQQETRLTCFGGNGEGHRLVYSTATHQEAFDYGIKAFNNAWKYRFPTFILGDGYQAKMREALTLYNPEDRGIRLTPAERMVGRPGIPGRDREVAHHRNTYNIEEELYQLLQQHTADWNQMADQVVEWDHQGGADAELLLVAHGVVSRATLAAYQQLQLKGQKVAYFRPITLRPFPIAALREAVAGCQQILLVESAYGQLQTMVRDALYGHTTVPMHGLLKPGVGITSDEVVQAAEALLHQERRPS
ncbi:MAG: ferredoxin oxidoreductase [Bacillota bacterium]